MLFSVLLILLVGSCSAYLQDGPNFVKLEHRACRDYVNRRHHAVKYYSNSGISHDICRDRCDYMYITQGQICRGYESKSGDCSLFFDYVVNSYYLLDAWGGYARIAGDAVGPIDIGRSDLVYDGGVACGARVPYFLQEDVVGSFHRVNDRRCTDSGGVTHPYIGLGDFLTYDDKLLCLEYCLSMQRVISDLNNGFDLECIGVSFLNQGSNGYTCTLMFDGARLNDMINYGLNNINYPAAWDHVAVVNLLGNGVVDVSSTIKSDVRVGDICYAKDGYITHSPTVDTPNVPTPKPTYQPTIDYGVDEYTQYVVIDQRECLDSSGNTYASLKDATSTLNECELACNTLHTDLSSTNDNNFIFCWGFSLQVSSNAFTTCYLHVRHDDYAHGITPTSEFIVSIDGPANGGPMDIVTTQNGPVVSRKCYIRVVAPTAYPTKTPSFAPTAPTHNPTSAPTRPIETSIRWTILGSVFGVFGVFFVIYIWQKRISKPKQSIQIEE